MSFVFSRVFNFFTAVSLLLAVLVAVLWGRSRSWTDNLFLSGSGRLWWVISEQRRLGFRTVHDWPGRQWPVWVTYKPGEDFGGPELWNYETSDPPPTRSEWHNLACTDASFRTLKRKDGSALWTRHRQPLDGAGLFPTDLMETRTLSGPHWVALIPLGMLPALWAVSIGRRQMVRRRRRKTGLCVACGYDLRASSGCCPECGRERK